MSSTREVLLEKLHDRTARVVILGLGYVGLPLAAVFAEAGFHVTGVEPDKKKVESLLRGDSYIQDVSSEQVSCLVREGRLSATSEFSALQTADAVSICVPTPLRKTGDPDLSYILNASESLAKFMHSGMVIVLESTTYPGTDKTIKDGLGLRWALMGPFETIDLNAPGGIPDYAARYGPKLHGMMKHVRYEPWDAALIAKIEAERRKTMSQSQHATREAWRDRRLMALIAHKRAMAQKD